MGVKLGLIKLSREHVAKLERGLQTSVFNDGGNLIKVRSFVEVC